MFSVIHLVFPKSCNIKITINVNSMGAVTWICKSLGFELQNQAEVVVDE